MYSRKKFFEPVWLVSKLSRGVHYEDNLEYTFKIILLKPFDYFSKIFLSAYIENIHECTFEKFFEAV